MDKPSPSFENDHPAEIQMEHQKEKASFSPPIANKDALPIHKTNADHQNNISLSDGPNTIVFNRSRQFEITPLNTKLFYLDKPIRTPNFQVAEVVLMPDLIKLPPLISNLTFDHVSADSLKDYSIERTEAKQSKWASFIEAGMFSTQQQLFAGSSIYYKKALNLGKTNKLSLHAGLGWKYQDFWLNEGGLFSSTEDASINSPSSEMDAQSGAFNMDRSSMDNSSMVQDQSKQNLSLEGGHYLSLPISFNYRWKPRWEFRTGANLDYLLNGQSSEREDVAFNFANTGAVTNLLTTSNFQLSANLGLYYRLNPKWSLGYQYNYGLNAAYQLDTEKFYFRRHHLSLRYQLK